MPVLFCGNQIRLTGKEAEAFLEETGKSKLPTTVEEYNQALQETIEYWLSTNCQEGKLLAALLNDKLLKL